MGKKRASRQLVRALDTNVLIRLFVGDDAEQSGAAAAVMTTPVFVPLTVILETAWVLRSRYRYSRAQTATILSALLDYDTVTVDTPELVNWAIDRFAVAGDFADLLHIVGSAPASSFATFDRGVAQAAGGDPPLPVETLA
jgi:predicted nucleic-acid-binding protein